MDIGSSIKLFILNVFNKLGLDKNRLVKVFYPLVGLEDKIVVVLATINLPLVLGDEKHKQELYAEFAVADILLVYNVILGRPVLKCHDIVFNVDTMCLKLLVLKGIVVIRGNPKMAKECYKHKKKKPQKSNNALRLTGKKLESHIKSEPIDPIEKVKLDKDQKVRFGTALIRETKNSLIKLLKYQVITFA